MLKTPGDKVQMFEEVEGEKSKRELCSVYSDGPAMRELVSLRLLTAQIQTPQPRPTAEPDTKVWVATPSVHYFNIHMYT